MMERIICSLSEKHSYIRKLGLFCLAFIVLIGINILNPSALYAGSNDNTSYSKKEYGLVIDEANILTSSEEDKLEEKCKKASEECGADVIVFTCKKGLDGDTFDKYLVSVAKNGYNGDSAVIYGVDMISRADRMVKIGDADKKLSMSTLDKIREKSAERLHDGKYEKAFAGYVDGIRMSLSSNVLYKLTTNIGIKLLISLAVAVVVVLCLMYSAKTRMTAGNRTYAGNSMKIRRREDRFINTTQTTRKIESSSKSGGSSHGGGSDYSSSGGHF